MNRTKKLLALSAASIVAMTMMVPANGATKTKSKARAKTATTKKGATATTAAPAGTAAPATTAPAAAAAAPAATGPAKVWMITSLTGPIAANGVPASEGVRLVVDKYNATPAGKSRPVVLTLKDDESKPDRAADYARDAIKDGAMAVIGGSTGSTCLSMRPLLVEAKILQYCLSGAFFDFNDKYFYASSAEPVANIGAQPSQWMKDRGLKEAACIATSDAGGDAHANAFAIAAPKFGIKQTTERFKPGDTDVTTQMIAASTAKTDVIYGCVSGLNLVPIIQAANALRMNVPIWAGLGAASVPVAQAIKDILPKQGVFTTGTWITLIESIPDSVVQKQMILDFAKEYTARFNKQPDTFVSAGADGVSLVIEGLKAGATNGTQLSEAIEKLGDYHGLSSDYFFGPGVRRGQLPSGIVMQYTSKGDFKYVGMVKVPRS